MKIAVSSADGVTVAPHFRLTECFLVYDVKNGQAGEPQVLPMVWTEDRHTSAADSLKGCSVVLCGGAGPGMVETLEAHGIGCIVVADTAIVPSHAAEACAAGTLQVNPDHQCWCGH